MDVFSFSYNGQDACSIDHTAVGIKVYGFMVAREKPGCYDCGITLRSGKKGFVVYRDGKVVEQYSVINKNAHQSER